MRLAPLVRLTKLGDRGNVAIMTAVVLPLLLLVGGFAVDYGYASYVNQRLIQATDDAVLGSVSQSAATAGGGYANTAWLQSYGSSIFYANTANLPISDVKFNLVVTPNGTGGVNSVGSFSYSYNTFFSGLIGMNSMPLQSQIRATANPITYIDYYIVLDVSNSMGIAATQKDMDALYTRGLTMGAGSFGEASCVFACHTLRKDQAGPQTNEQIAHISPRIPLRIDAAVTAIQHIISAAQSASGSNQNIRIGLYTISRDPNVPGSYYTVISKPTSDYSTLIAQANQIDLNNNVADAVGDTDFTSSLTAFTTELPLSNGSGASGVSPKNYVFLITDGLTDTGNLNACKLNCPTPIDPNDCAQMKARATVGTIYTTYNPIYLQNNKSNGPEPVFAQRVAPFLTFDSQYNVIADQMATNLQSCSSDASKFYFAAVDGPAIDSAMNALFQSTLQNAKLTK